MTGRACCPSLLLMYMLTYVLFVFGRSRCSRLWPILWRTGFHMKTGQADFRFCVLEPETVESATAEESSDGILVICHRWMWCYYQSCASCLREVIGSSPSRDTSCLGRRLRVFPVPAARFRDDVSSEAYLTSFRVFSSDFSRCSSYLLTLYS